MTDFLPSSVLTFLEDIRDNNNRAWFEANRARYEAARSAFLSFVEFMIVAVQAVDPGVGEQEAAKCIYRMNRDIRFSPDKSPYKRHFGAFVAPGGRKSVLPGYYLHIQPGNESFFCTGNYGLSAELLKRLRTEVANFPEELDAIVTAPAFKERMTLSDDEKLKTLPRGYVIEPRYQDYLKYKSLNAVARYSDNEVTSPGFGRRLKADIALGQPLNAFSRRALETEAEEDLGL